MKPAKSDYDVSYLQTNHLFFPRYIPQFWFVVRFYFYLNQRVKRKISISLVSLNYHYIICTISVKFLIRRKNAKELTFTESTFTATVLFHPSVITR